jgi:ABC-2 type transport system permease protein
MLKAFLYSVVLELKMYLRIPMVLFWIVFFPLLQLFLFGALFGGNALFEMKIAVVDEDNTAASQELLADLRKAPVIKVYTGKRTELQEKLRRQEVYGLVVLAQGFAATLAQSKAELTVWYNPAQGPRNDILFAVLQEAVRLVNQKLSARPPLVLVTQPIIANGKTMSYVAHLVPGLIGFCLLSVAIFSIAIPITAAREKNYLKRIWVSPIPKSLYLMSFLVAGWLIALMQSALLLATGFFVYDICPLGSWWALLLWLNLGIMAFMAIGVCVASLSATTVTANILGSMIFFPMIFLSEVYFPIANLPYILQNIVHCFPLIHFLQVFRSITLEGSPLTQYTTQMLILLVWTVVPALIAIRFFTWTGKNGG